MSLKNRLKTTFEFSKNIFTTGAFYETSRKVELEVCTHLPQGDNKVIVEYGMGHGNISKEILNHISPTSKLYAFEVKKEFCEHVRETIDDDRLIIINDGAQNMSKYIDGDVHGFVGTIPFSFFSKEMAKQIIQDSYNKLVSGGYYTQALYTKFNYKKFVGIFDNCKLKRIMGIPIEYVYHCQKT